MSKRYIPRHQRRVVDVESVIVRNLVFPDGLLLLDGGRRDSVLQFFQRRVRRAAKGGDGDGSDVVAEGEWVEVYRSAPARGTLNPSWGLNESELRLDSAAPSFELRVSVSGTNSDEMQKKKNNNKTKKKKKSPTVLLRENVVVTDLVPLGLQPSELSTVFALPINTVLFQLSDGGLYCARGLAESLKSHGAIANIAGEGESAIGENSVMDDGAMETKGSALTSSGPSSSSSSSSSSAANGSSTVNAHTDAVAKEGSSSSSSSSRNSGDNVTTMSDGGGGSTRGVIEYIRVSRGECKPWSLSSEMRRAVRFLCSVFLPPFIRFSLLESFNPYLLFLLSLCRRISFRAN